MGRPAPPANDGCAGKRRSEQTRNGSRWVGIARTEAALAATRTKKTYLAAQYQRLRLRPRRGHKRALGAVKHSMLTAIWQMLQTGELYSDSGGDYFRRRYPDRQIKRLVADSEVGRHVTLRPIPV